MRGAGVGATWLPRNCARWPVPAAAILGAPPPEFRHAASRDSVAGGVRRARVSPLPPGELGPREWGAVRQATAGSPRCKDPWPRHAGAWLGARDL